MSKYLILIDNQQNELSTLFNLIRHSAEEQNILCKSVLIDRYDDNGKKQIHNSLREVIPKDQEKQRAVSFHIVVDACLLPEEHELSSINQDYSLSGLLCIKEIVPLLQETKCSFSVSLMSRFFIDHLEDYEMLQGLKNDESIHFFAVIKKPILDDGTVDKGYARIIRYSDILPKEYLAKNHIEAFINVLFYALKK